MRRAQRRARTSWARLGCVPTGSGIGDIFPKDICRLYFVEYLFMLFFSASFDSLLELSSRLCGYVIVFDEITTRFQDVKWVVFYPLEFNSHVPNCEVQAVRKSKAATNATPHSTLIISDRTTISKHLTITYIQQGLISYLWLRRVFVWATELYLLRIRMAGAFQGTFSTGSKPWDMKFSFNLNSELEQGDLIDMELWCWNCSNLRGGRGLNSI